ncbi:MAG: hydroxyisourate hydrolase [Acidobacteriota bacterium]
MNSITTHILDISIGRPAAGVLVRLDRQTFEGEWGLVGSRKTDSDGRVRDLIPEGEKLMASAYRLTFDVGPYFREKQVEGFYNEVTIGFVVTDASQHYHVPLLLSPFGYSTYRGS